MKECVSCTRCLPNVNEPPLLQFRTECIRDLYPHTMSANLPLFIFLQLVVDALFIFIRHPCNSPPLNVVHHELAWRRAAWAFKCQNNAHPTTTNFMAAVIVHGGAYTIPDSIAEASVRGCQNAAGLAYGALKEGKSAIDAGKQEAIHH